MKNQKEMQLEKILEVLSELGLTTILMEKAEKYLLEGEKVLLDDFPKQDLSEMNKEKQNKFITLFTNLLDRNHREEVFRLFQIVFQIGGSTSASVFPVQKLQYNLDKSEFIKDIEAYQAVSVYAEGLVYNNNNLHRSLIDNLLELAGNDKAVLKKALKNWQCKSGNGKLLIYTAYVSLLDRKNMKEQRKTSLLNDLTNIIRKKKVDEEADLEEENIISIYEAIIINSINHLLPVNEEEHNSIKTYLDEDKVGDKSLMDKAAQLFKNNSVNEYVFNLMVGCASMNYGISYRLQSFIKLCAYCDLDKTMDAVYLFMKRNDKHYFEGKFKEDFMLETVPYLLWCGKLKILEALYYEIEKDCETYIIAMKQAPLEIYSRMMEALSKKAPDAYDRAVKEYKNELQSKIADKILPEDGVKQVVLDFLMGNSPIESLYPHVRELQNVRSYYSDTRNYINLYKKVIGPDDYYKRCMTYMLFRAEKYFFYQGFEQDEKSDFIFKEIEELFCAWEDTGLGLSYQLHGAELIYDSIYGDKRKASFFNNVVIIFSKYLNEKEDELLKAFESAEATGRYLGVCTLGVKAEQYKKQILNIFSDTSKLVKNQLLTIVSDHENWKKDVLDKLFSKKSTEREMALLILMRWKNDYKEVLEQVLETEKSKKLQDLIRTILQVEGNNEAKEELSTEDYIKELHKGGRKKGLLWAYETPFSAVHLNDGSVVTEEYLQAILLSYSGMTVPGVNKEVLPLIKALRKEELALYMNELFDKWMEKGAEAKKKWVLYASAIHGGADIVQKLHTNIKEWPQNARGAIAAEAVKALALNDSPTALLIVDGISRKFKFKQIKTAAAEALSFAAEQLGLTTEELSDKIVPDLGFNENMQRIFDYGERSFTVYITPALEIELFDENEKKIKNLPAPGKKDDEAKAQVAVAEFKLLKKQMKTTVTNQKLRLESALSVERKWDILSWKSLFIKNPIMHQFAIGLIWGIYEADKLTATFRYMEDGSFNTEDEEEFELPETGNIGLVHPIELSKENIKQWEEQLKDYEIVQPIEQLSRKIYPVTEEEKDKMSLDRFGGYILNTLSLSGKLMDMGWYRGSVQDAGGYYTFYREDTALAIGVELHFSGSFVGYENEEVTVYEARFYEAGTIKRGSYVYDEVTDKTAIALGKVPFRYFSEIVYQLTKATVSSQEKDEKWREKQ